LKQVRWCLTFVGLYRYSKTKSMAEIEIDVDNHEVMALDNNMRQPWPTEGMPCEVSKCSDYIYSTYNSYIKHWKKYHTDTTVVKRCAKCSQEYRTNNKLRTLIKLSSA